MSSAEEVELWMKGVNYFEDGRFKDAIFDFQRVSVTAKIVYNIGLCYYRLNEKSKAVKVSCRKYSRFIIISFEPSTPDTSISVT